MYAERSLRPSDRRPIVVSIVAAVAFTSLCGWTLSRGGLPRLFAQGSSTLPNMFVNGKTADAEEVNANFAHLEDRIAELEGKTASAGSDLLAEVSALRAEVASASARIDQVAPKGKVDYHITSAVGAIWGSERDWVNVIVPIVPAADANYDVVFTGASLNRGNAGMTCTYQGCDKEKAHVRFKFYVGKTGWADYGYSAVGEIKFSIIYY